MYNIMISSHTDVGDRKETNQDSILQKVGEINGHQVALFIVADGCGGLAYGEEISNLIVSYFSRVWKNELPRLLENKKVKNEQVDAMLEQAIREINIGAKSFGTQVDSRVGSTLSLLLTIDRRYFIKNVGDSRVYRKRGNKFFPLTEDQSLVADMLRRGELTPEEAKTFKKKNVLTMCIGVFEEIHTYSNCGKLKHGDVFLLCCDGLHNLVPSEMMLKILKNRKIPFEDKATSLRGAIESGKANDNVSVITVKYKKAHHARPVWISLGIIAVILAALIAWEVYAEQCGAPRLLPFRILNLIAPI